MADRSSAGDPLLADREKRARLERWLEQNVPGFSSPFTLSAFSGGQSNPTYRITYPAGDCVLRRKPFGALLPSAHAIEREFRVMRALAGSGVPVPRVIALCEDPAVIGAAFYAMEFIDGRIFWDPSLPGLAPNERSAIYEGLNSAMAALHAVDPDAVGLGDYGRRSGYMARQITRWSQQYRASETQKIDAMDGLIDWLPQHVPPEAGTSIVHGDFRIDNVIFHKTEPRPLAILDWELSTLGDPNADFAYHVMSWRLSSGLFRGLADHDLPTLGIPSERDYAATYFARARRPPSDHWEVYLAFNLFRLAAILQGVGKRALDGNAADANALEMGARARPIAELAWKIALQLS